MKQSAGHVDFIGPYEFYALEDGRLFRAETSKPIGEDGKRQGHFITSMHGTVFALRLARITASQPEKA